MYTADLTNPESNGDADINTDSSLHRSRHVAMLLSDETRTRIIMGFEDLHRTDRIRNPVGYESDEDFNDNVFCISPNGLGAIANSDIPVADGGCLVDLNQDGVLNFFDIAIYLDRFTMNDPLVDLKNDGELNFFDLSVLIDAFANGCLGLRSGVLRFVGKRTNVVCSKMRQSVSLNSPRL